jgi:hypothetical protein
MIGRPQRFTLWALDRLLIPPMMIGILQGFGIDWWNGIVVLPAARALTHVRGDFPSAFRFDGCQCRTD